MTTRTHTIRTKHRTGTLTVTERADRIDMRLIFDCYGELGDGAEVMPQLWAALIQFDRDPRPIKFEAPDFGARLLVDTDEQGRPFAIATQETRQ